MPNPPAFSAAQLSCAGVPAASSRKCSPARTAVLVENNPEPLVGLASDVMRTPANIRLNFYC